jgi:hypothetical protein
MPALKHDITIEQGADFEREFTVTDPVTGAPIDLSNHDVRGSIFNLVGTKVADFLITVTLNKVLIKILSATATGLTAAQNFNHEYDVIATHATLPDYRIAQGKVLVSKQHTV